MKEQNQIIGRPALLIGGIVLALVVLAGFGMLSKGMAASSSASASAAAAAAEVSVTSAKVVQENMPIYVAGVGTVQANATVTVKTRVDGQLDKVGFIEGQDVKAGQLIAQIDPRSFQAQLAQAEAQKARDQAQLANARLDLQRYETLIKQDAVTQQTLDTQKALVLQLGATVQTDDAQVSYAKVQLDYTTIKAPLSGRIGARLVDPGNIVHAADATGLVVINQVDPIAVVFTLPEESFQDINRAMQDKSHVPVVYAYPRNSDQVLGKGLLVLLNNQIDTTSGTVQMKGRFSNPSHALWPGQYVNVRLVIGTRQNALTVPAAAIQRSQDGTYVYTVKPDNTAQMQPVQVIRIQDGKAVIGKGVNAGDRVVVDGQYKLKSGSHVIEGKPAAAPQTTLDKGAGN